jgi:hypothetical protein
MQSFRQIIRTATEDFGRPAKIFTEPGDWRHEIKFAFPFWMEPSARLQLLRSSSGFRTSYPSRTVNNIYFDTVDQQAVRSNFAGVGDRAKVRLRWYSDTRVAVNPVLEVKIKERGVGKKLHHPLHGEFDLTQFSWSGLRQTISEEADPEIIQHFGSTRQPMLFNSYRRQYFETFDKTVRATIDTDIRSCTQRETTRPRLEFITPPSTTMVVELKAAVAEEKNLREASKSLGWRVGRHSKYIRGIFNRFG